MKAKINELTQNKTVRDLYADTDKMKRDFQPIISVLND